jgi:uncharacterized protein YbbC (DUF1343 family)
VNLLSRILLSLLLFLLGISLLAPLPSLSQGLTPEQLSSIPKIVEEAIGAGQTPGAVILIGSQGQVVFRQAFGYSTLEPQRVPMTLSTIFDIASLTKVVATTPALLQLVEQGKMSLDDAVVKHWPEFKGQGKERITVRQLLTHYSGLRASISLKPNWLGYEAALKKIAQEKPLYPPDTHFIYSDLNFIILGELIQRISGQPMDRYCRNHIFHPLGMEETLFNPPQSMYARLAPTKENHRGEVHDPTVNRMGGLGGHAGLFSTADDLAIFAQALLDVGRSEKAQILSRNTIETMILPHSPPEQVPLRGLGWEIHSPSGSSWNELIPPGSIGHKGFTGTLIWIDPVSNSYLIVLTNRVYPSGKGNYETLRNQVLFALAQALGRAPVLTDPILISQVSLQSPGDSIRHFSRRVQTGVEVLVANKFAPLAGKRMGLITNQTGIDSNGRRTIDLLHKAPKVKLKVIFAPEHGLSGRADGKVSSTRDPSTRLQIYSLYGESLRPTPKMLKGLDALVFDVQDAGVRFYTYITTMAFAMEAAAQKGIPFYVLDRPNPINASRVQGPIMEPDLKSFTGYFPLPIRHGMTAGELAKMFNGENKMGVKLEVVPMNGYRRDSWFDETGLPWVNPSPNLRSLTQAILYPGVALVEGSNVSVGRGTDTPFELIGAPWIKAQDLTDYLFNRRIPGIELRPAAFIPESNRFQNQVCYGVQIILTDRDALDSTALGIEMISALYQLYPHEFQIDKTLSLIGSRSVLQAIKEGQHPLVIAHTWQEPLEQFRALRSKYLIYSE